MKIGSDYVQNQTLSHQLLLMGACQEASYISSSDLDVALDVADG